MNWKGLQNVGKIFIGIGKGTAYTFKKGGKGLVATLAVTAIGSVGGVALNSVMKSFQTGNSEKMAEIGSDMFEKIWNEEEK